MRRMGRSLVVRGSGLALCFLACLTAGAARAGDAPSKRHAHGERKADAAPGKVVPELPLTLADAVFIGLRKNTTIKSAYIQRIAQRFDLRVAEDAFTPHATLGASAMHQSTGGVVSDTVDVAPTVQALTPIGTQFNFTWDNNASRQPGQTAASSTLTASVTQPLLQGAGLDVNLAPVKTARLGEDINQLALRQTVSQAITDIVTAYRNLAGSLEAKKLADDAVGRSQALLDMDKDLIQAGRLAPMEIVQAQADLENQKLAVLEAESQVDAARLALAVLLDVDLRTHFTLRDKLDAKPIPIAVDEALKLALRFRPDYLIQLDTVEQAKLGIVVADNQRLWNVSLVGNATLARSVQNTKGSGSFFGKTADAAVGVQLTAPLNDLTLQQAYLHATTSFQAGEVQLAVTRQNVEQQVRLSAETIDLDWREVESARRVVALAASAVDVEKQKLQAGRSSVFDVRSLEGSYRDSLVQKLNAEITYVNALTQFDLQLGTTLKTWQVSLAGQ